MPDGLDEPPSTERSASRQTADVCSFQRAMSLLDTSSPSPDAGEDAEDVEDEAFDDEGCEEEEAEESACVSAS